MCDFHLIHFHSNILVRKTFLPVYFWANIGEKILTGFPLEASLDIKGTLNLLEDNPGSGVPPQNGSSGTEIQEKNLSNTSTLVVSNTALC